MIRVDRHSFARPRLSSVGATLPIACEELLIEHDDAPIGDGEAFATTAEEPTEPKESPSERPTLSIAPIASTSTRQRTITARTMTFARPITTGSTHETNATARSGTATTRSKTVSSRSATLFARSRIAATRSKTAATRSGTISARSAALVARSASLAAPTAMFARPTGCLLPEKPVAMCRGTVMDPRGAALASSDCRARPPTRAFTEVKVASPPAPVSE